MPPQKSKTNFASWSVTRPEASARALQVIDMSFWGDRLALPAETVEKQMSKQRSHKTRSRRHDEGARRGPGPGGTKNI
jgi:hypothetical protein